QCISEPRDSMGNPEVGDKTIVDLASDLIRSEIKLRWRKCQGPNEFAELARFDSQMTRHFMAYFPMTSRSDEDFSAWIKRQADNYLGAVQKFIWSAAYPNPFHKRQRG
ncbi:hypothetical protein T310_8591, partial [Rasamsonia emersonii CBS 393.64]